MICIPFHLKAFNHETQALNIEYTDLVDKQPTFDDLKMFCKFS